MRTKDYCFVYFLLFSYKLEKIEKFGDEILEIFFAITFFK